MTQIRFFVGTILACLLVTAVASADPINVTGSTGGWQAMPAPSQSGTPFWNNGSYDGANMNIGFYLTKTGGFASSLSSPNLALSNLNYWGTNTGGFDPTEAFGTTPANSPVTTTLKLEVAGFSNTNVLGYYDATGDHVIFLGPDSAGAQGTINAIGTFGLYITTQQGNTFRSAPGLYGTTSSDNYQHFALFQELDNGKIWIGVEDLKVNSDGSGSDKDFNDMVISLEAVPEPASVLSFVIGGLAVGCYGAYRRRQKPAIR
jgi:hypothetical protein